MYQLNAILWVPYCRDNYSIILIVLKDLLWSIIYLSRDCLQSSVLIVSKFKQIN